MPFSLPRGIEQSLVLPPRWPLILYTGTLYCTCSPTIRERVEGSQNCLLRLCACSLSVTCLWRRAFS